MPEGKKNVKIVLRLLLAVAALITAWLLLAPTRVMPVSWNAPPAPSLRNGPYAVNDRLKDIERIARVGAIGPETVAIDTSGRIYTGFLDGRVASFAADGSDYHLIVNTGGRPLGVAVHPDGSLIVADAFKGLLRVQMNGSVEVLSTTADGLPFAFTDYVALDHDGHFAYFSDASSKWHFGQDQLAMIEHGGDGRLLRYDFATHQTQVLLKDLQFANGVALDPDENFVLVNETGAYRITRYWLKGDKAGSHDLFVDNLPGFPDNLTCNGRDRFWVAIPVPRDPLLDSISAQPFLRTVVARIVAVLPLPMPHHGMALGFDLQGKLVANLHYAGPGAYSRITHVVEDGQWLYFGSLTEDSIGRMRNSP